MQDPAQPSFLPDWLHGQEGALVTQTAHALLDHLAAVAGRQPDILDRLRAADVALSLLHVQRAEAEFNNPDARLEKTLTYAGRARDRLRRAIAAFDKTARPAPAAPAPTPEAQELLKLSTTIAHAADIAAACQTQESPQETVGWYGDLAPEAISVSPPPESPGYPERPQGPPKTSPKQRLLAIPPAAPTAAANAVSPALTARRNPAPPNTFSSPSTPSPSLAFQHDRTAPPSDRVPRLTPPPKSFLRHPT